MNIHSYSILSWLWLTWAAATSSFPGEAALAIGASSTLSDVGPPPAAYSPNFL